MFKPIRNKPEFDAVVVKIVRETFEWSNNWWDHADDMSLPRVLLIGDSVSCGYGPVVNERLQGTAYVDRMANSRGLHDPILFKEIRMALEDGVYRVIHFNNGLHGHLSVQEYGRRLENYLQMIQELSKGAKLIWASSTPVTQPVTGHPIDEKINGLVIDRNAVAEKIMQKYHIPINDLYPLMLDKDELRRPQDGFHYNDHGNQILGNVVTNRIFELMGE
jgi:hypothetical protein